jgi:small subunit ribosomal protein S6
LVVPYYESVYIARPDISTAQVDALAESLTSIVGENGGAVTKNEYWGLKNLAYRIKKNRKGHYTLLNIDAPAGAISELERNMRINEDVLRYMTIRVDELDENPSVMLTSRGPRDSRDRGRDRDRNGPREGDRKSAAAETTTTAAETTAAEIVPETATDAAPEAAAEGNEE